MTSTKKIGVIDAKILKDLLKDGRKEFPEIAKEIGVSKDVIWQHYTNMKKEGIIVGATVQINYASLGYNTTASIFVSVEPQKQIQVMESIRRIQNIFDVIPLGNHSEIWVIAILRNIEEMDQVKQSIKQLPSVLRLRTEVWTGIRNMVENLSILSADKTLNETNSSKMQTRSGVGKIGGKIDGTDIQIIEKLAKNGRESFRKIADELKISTSTIINRYRKLKRDGTIKVTIQINPIKIGYPAEAIFGLAFVPQQSLPIVEKIAKIPDVTLILKTSGIFDLTVFLKIRNVEQLIAIQDEIANIPGITEIERMMLNAWPLMPYPREYISTF